MAVAAALLTPSATLLQLAAASCWLADQVDPSCTVCGPIPVFLMHTLVLMHDLL